MNCKECGNPIGKFRVKTDKGHQRLCPKCLKQRLKIDRATRRYSRVVKTNDPFILLCRRLVKVSNYSKIGSFVALGEAGEKVYTNSHVLLANTPSVSNDDSRCMVKLMHLDSLSFEEWFYPDTRKTTEHPLSTSTVDIPKEFFDYLKVFNVKSCGEGYVDILPGMLHVYEAGDRAIMKMDYKGIDTSKLDFPVRFDAAYFDALKPGRIIFGNDKGSLCSFENCYARGTEGLTYVRAMPCNPSYYQ